ncbi:MAG: hypothetical protein FRX49_11993 [Trebouxia sp. A1-2]|nr:MAG: hypothetical protein FRX49_11993 [Trebouxia sp. A1-2]
MVASLCVNLQKQFRRWGLSFLGRVHVAKQVLAASLWYHASFQRPSEQLLKQLSQQLRKFVASAQQPDHSDDAVALAQGHSQGSAQLPCAAPGAALFPGELASSLPLSKGGVGLVHVPTQVQALQAKVISRLLEPERLAWKVFQLHHLSQASQVQPLGYGASILFSTLHTDQLQLPARLSAYVAAFRALHPHRLQSVSAMLPSDVLNEPLFFNRQISQPATSPAAINTACPAAAASFLTPQQKPLMLSAGITKVAHLRLSLQLQQPQLLALELNSVLLALPPAWRAVVSSAPAFTWFQVRSASGRQLIQDAQTGQLHTIGPHLQLQQVPLQPVLDPSPVQVISWDPSRPWRGPAHQSGQLGSHLYLQGPLWGQHHLSLGVWGWGSQPAHQLVVKQAGLRLRLIRSFATKHPLAPGGLTCRPRLLPMPASGQSVVESLQAIEARAYIGRATPAQATCPFSCCIGLSQPQTISHLFITCPVAATTQASSAAQHLGGVSDCPSQPANTSSRCLGAGRNPSVISFITTSIIYLTPWPPGEATSFEDYQGHDSQ